MRRRSPGPLTHAPWLRRGRGGLGASAGTDVSGPQEGSIMHRLWRACAAGGTRLLGGLHAILALGMAISLGTVSPALGLTCDRQVVSEGQTAWQVMAIC